MTAPVCPLPAGCHYADSYSCETLGCGCAKQLDFLARGLVERAHPGPLAGAMAAEGLLTKGLLTITGKGRAALTRRAA